jgi:hypothetical protein
MLNKFIVSSAILAATNIFDLKDYPHPAALLGTTLLAQRLIAADSFIKKATIGITLYLAGATAQKAAENFINYWVSDNNYEQLTKVATFTIGATTSLIADVVLEKVMINKFIITCGMLTTAHLLSMKDYLHPMALLGAALFAPTFIDANGFVRKATVGITLYLASAATEKAAEDAIYSLALGNDYDLREHGSWQEAYGQFVKAVSIIIGTTAGVMADATLHEIDPSYFSNSLAKGIGLIGFFAAIAILIPEACSASETGSYPTNIEVQMDFLPNILIDERIINNTGTDCILI